MYWNIGKVILEYSKWGNKFVENLSKDLKIEYPNSKGYTVRNLNYMKQFAMRISNEEILHQAGEKISWKAIKLLIDKTETVDEHIWYTTQCIENGWSSTVLAHQLESGLYSRQVLAIKTTNFKEQLLQPLGEQAEEIIKDPYNREFFIDLLFYNVKLHCYFVVELKTVEFEPEFAGKLSFYLSAIDGELKAESDNPTIGLLLCKGKDKVVAEYALKDVNKPMGISDYKLSNKISDDLQKNLPTIEDIENRINS